MRVLVGSLSRNRSRGLSDSGRVRVQGLGQRRVQGLGFRVQGLGFRVLGFGFWVLGFGFWVHPQRLPRNNLGAMSRSMAGCMIFRFGLKVNLRRATEKFRVSKC